MHVHNAVPTEYQILKNVPAMLCQNIVPQNKMK